MEKLPSKKKSKALTLVNGPYHNTTPLKKIKNTDRLIHCVFLTP